jgi:hypothetical protein
MAGKRITYDISRILELVVAASLATAVSIAALILLCHDQARAAASWDPAGAAWSWQDWGVPWLVCCASSAGCVPASASKST